ncbi:peptide methionine sulfoxide reductase msrA/msrB [Nitrosomonas eutropha]|uniref:Peptide methionine sulfoxide reductase MsrA n=2 Tax=Nitrosomonas eutropha TaxID=916 RepID=A0ABX5M891_9PROT|nr:peptide methionine sulfoxide reductase msrA/msrB [Nitrosomonas eutropha]SCX20986.1 peptide methionine sulfoxide reductase msrA/msrB [Nitrosomonas eutropha]SEI41662.1 peptide methionine sulfoxide reductase msrA/msrB [Nitrosomonas eutropha]
MKTIIAALIILIITMVITVFAMEKIVTPSSVNSNQTTDSKSNYIVLGMGCFWGAEKRMGELPGVVDVESGYAGGDHAGVGYEDILNFERALRIGRAAGRNHAEVVKVTFAPEQVSLESVLAKFWESHNPTQGDRQGNDIGSNYRSAIYYHDEDQKTLALATRDTYQQALTAAGYGQITTEILPLKNYITAEEYHQNYLKKNPDGYCGLGGIGVKYPAADHTKDTTTTSAAPSVQPLDSKDLNFDRQLVVFESENCEFCVQFKQDILDHWQADVPMIVTMNANPPTDWVLDKPLFASPTMVLFSKGKEVARYTGYNGEKEKFWQWLGFQLLTPEQQKIAFEQGTERAFTGSNLDEKRPGRFVDPITGVTLFRSQTKFNSGTGWPSFFEPAEGSVTYHKDNSGYMQRIEVRSASSGIHLGHVFNDGPPPSHKRYCINGNVLKFVPD